MTTFSDIFKSSFMENLSSVSIPDALIALALAFALGLFIFLIYKKNLCWSYVFFRIWGLRSWL